MALTNIEYGSVASSGVLNNNFNYLEQKIEDYSKKLDLNNASLTALINSQIASTISQLTTNITNNLQAVYPVGSIYIGVTDTCPIAELFGTWEKVSSGRVLQGTSGSQKAGNTVEAGLPNITGGLIRTNYEQVPGGALYQEGGRAQFTDGRGSFGINIGFDASRSNAIYGRSNTVQPPAYLVNIWRRVA